MCTAGLLVALLFGARYDRLPETLYMLVYMTGLGMLLDIGYDRLQVYRWDNDWPPVYHVASGLLEGALFWAVMLFVNLPGLNRPVTFGQFLVMYLSMFLVMFLVNWNLMKVIFINWRYRGGRIL